MGWRTSNKTSLRIVLEPPFTPTCRQLDAWLVTLISLCNNTSGTSVCETWLSQPSLTIVRVATDKGSITFALEVSTLPSVRPTTASAFSRHRCTVTTENVWKEISPTVPTSSLPLLGLVPTWST